jgi:hypothetical protein
MYDDEFMTVVMCPNIKLNREAAGMTMAEHFRITGAPR